MLVKQEPQKNFWINLEGTMQIKKEPSNRSKKCIKSTPLVTYHFMCELDPKKADSQSIINIGTAENYLNDESNLRYLNSFQPIFKNTDLHYNDHSGPQPVKKAVAAFAKQFFSINLTWSNVVVGAGVTSLLEILQFVLLQEGESIILLAPYYSGYSYELTQRFNGKIVNCNFYSLDRKFNFDKLQQTIKISKAKVLLLNNPVNPCGYVWSASELFRLIDICQKNRIEIITDQIQGNMCYQKQFISLLKLGRYKDHIHWLYGMSKDFGLAGLKVGFLYTQNLQLLRVIKKVIDYHTGSTINGLYLQKILMDFEYCKKIFTNSKNTLLTNKNFITDMLSKQNIQVTQPEGGCFILMNLSKFGINTKQQEQEMTLKLIHEAKVYISPGHLFNTPQFGWFRLCFAKESFVIEEAIKRIIRFLEQNLRLKKQKEQKINKLKDNEK